MARVLSTGTAVPPHRYAQSRLRDAAREAFAGMPGLDRLLSVFDHAGIESRAFARPLEYLLAGHPFSVRNRDWIDAAVGLGAQAVLRACEKADVSPDRFGTIVFTTTTGLATPSIDALLVERAGLARDIRRVPIFGIGCAGGVAAVALAARLADERPALALSIELCGMTFLIRERSRTNLVGAALFGDGAAAAVLGEGRGPRVADSRVEIFPDTGHVMGWDFVDEGMRLVLSPEVPEMVPHARRMVDAMRPIDRWVLHPGGPRVIDAYARHFGVPEERLAPTRQFLRDHGNLSSASALFILDATRANAGERGLMLSLGPGFAAEAVRLEWT